MSRKSSADGMAVDKILPTSFQDFAKLRLGLSDFKMFKSGMDRDSSSGKNLELTKEQRSGIGTEEPQRLSPSITRSRVKGEAEPSD